MSRPATRPNSLYPEELEIHTLRLENLTPRRPLSHAYSYFENAHHFSIENVTIHPTQVARPKRLTRTPFEYLMDNMADGAMHNSAERSDAPKCHIETRVAVQQDVFSWISHGDSDARPTQLMLLTGPAGSGKTAIAGSIAEECEKQGLLAASFFFSSHRAQGAESGYNSRRTKRCFVSTLAYQMAQHRGMADGVGRRVLNEIVRDPKIFKRRLEDQLEALILRPLREAHPKERERWPRAIVIDGVDECDVEEYLDRAPTSGVQRSKEDDHLEILNLLLRATQDPAFPFRIVVASRPERIIQTFFSTAPACNITSQIVLDQRYNPDADIALYLRAKFAELSRWYNLWEWPSDAVIRTLVSRASGQFIYAVTVIRFIEGRASITRRRGSVDPQAQLDCVLKSRLTVDGESPLAPLDALYMCIIRTSPDPVMSVRWVRLIDSMLRGHPAVFVRQFLESVPREAEALLGGLASLIFNPQSALNESGEMDLSPYHFYHKSLADFLDDPRRCKGLYVSIEDTEQFYRGLYLRVLKDKKAPVSLREPDHKVFIDRFFNWLEAPKAFTPNEIISPESDLLQCDVVWCVQTSYETVRAEEPRRFSIVLFDGVHAYCNWYKCNTVCRHWRKNILKASKAQGWRLPQAVHALDEDDTAEHP